jgi:hypothetical protein
MGITGRTVTGNLDLVLPNGKYLANCPLADVKDMREWMHAVLDAMLSIARDDYEVIKTEPSLDDANWSSNQ